MFRAYLIPNVGRGQVIKPRVVKTASDTMAVGVHEANMLMIRKPAITEVEVVVFRTDTKLALRHEMVRMEQ